MSTGRRWALAWLVTFPVAVLGGALVVVATVAVNLFAAGLADETRARDPRDFEGDFDIRKVSQTHGPSGTVRHAIRTHGGWRGRDLRDGVTDEASGSRFLRRSYGGATCPVTGGTRGRPTLTAPSPIKNRSRASTKLRSA